MDEISKRAYALELQRDIVYDRKENRARLKDMIRWCIIVLIVTVLGGFWLSTTITKQDAKGPPPAEVEQTQTYERVIEITPTFSW